MSAREGALRRMEWDWLGQHGGKEASQEATVRSSITCWTLDSGLLCLAHRGNGVGGVVAPLGWGMAGGVE